MGTFHLTTVSSIALLNLCAILQKLAKHKAAIASSSVRVTRQRNAEIQVPCGRPVVVHSTMAPSSYPNVGGRSPISCVVVFRNRARNGSGKAYRIHHGHA